MTKATRVAFVLALCCTGALAVTIDFDGAWSDLGDEADPATYYQGTLGVTFSGTYFGLVGGNGNGDPGNWNLEGTNGSAFLGTNDGIGTGPDILFDSVASSVSLDVGLPSDFFGGWTNDIIATAFLGGSVVESHTVTISSPIDPGNWASIGFGVPLDRVEVRLGGGNGWAFGLDNINFENDVIPEPATLSLLALGGLGLLRKRRRR